MKRIVHIALSAALAASLAACAPAEQKESKLQIERSEQATTVATVEAVDLTRRTVKLRSLDGQPFVVRVGKEAVNLPQVKKGDQVEVTYARELEVTLADPGEVVNETDVVVDRAQPGSKPEGSAIAQTRVTATILDLDKEREKVAQGKFTYHAQYFHFLFQLLQYDPDAKEKLRNLVDGDYAYWRAAIQRAIATGELREDVDVEDAVVMFRQVYMGLSFEMAFMGGLNTQRLAKHLHAVYSLLKR